VTPGDGQATKERMTLKTFLGINAAAERLGLKNRLPETFRATGKKIYKGYRLRNQEANGGIVDTGAKYNHRCLGGCGKMVIKGWFCPVCREEKNSKRDIASEAWANMPSTTKGGI